MRVYWLAILMALAGFSGDAWTAPQPRPRVRTQATHGTLVIRITGFKQRKGHAMVSLFRSAKGFPGQYKHAYLQRIAVVQGKQITFQIRGVPFGLYAAAVLHDINSNKKLDTGIFGIPKEPYGASNNARRLMGPPRFRDAKFKFTKHKQMIQFQVK